MQHCAPVQKSLVSYKTETQPQKSEANRTNEAMHFWFFLFMLLCSSVSGIYILFEDAQLLMDIEEQNKFINDHVVQNAQFSIDLYFDSLNKGSGQNLHQNVLDVLKHMHESERKSWSTFDSDGKITLKQNRGRQLLLVVTPFGRQEEGDVCFMLRRDRKYGIRDFDNAHMVAQWWCHQNSLKIRFTILKFNHKQEL